MPDPTATNNNNNNNNRAAVLNQLFCAKLAAGQTIMQM